MAVVDSENFTTTGALEFLGTLPWMSAPAPLSWGPGQSVCRPMQERVGEVPAERTGTPSPSSSQSSRPSHLAVLPLTILVFSYRDVVNKRENLEGKSRGKIPRGGGPGPGKKIVKFFRAWRNAKEAHRGRIRRGGIGICRGGSRGVEEKCVCPLQREESFWQRLHKRKKHSGEEKRK